MSLAVVFSLTACAQPAPAPAKKVVEKTVLLFSFFREPGGQAGLQLATSEDGLKWAEIRAPNGKSFLELRVGGKLMRDPSLALGPDCPFGPAGATFITNRVEGPSAIQLRDEYYACFDHYRNPKCCGAVKSADLEHWQDISGQVSFSNGTRHGTLLKVPEGIVRNLQDQETSKPIKP